MNIDQAQISNGLLRSARNDGQSTRNGGQSKFNQKPDLTASTKGVAAHPNNQQSLIGRAKLMSSSSEQNKSQHENIEQLSNPGAEPPKDPQNPKKAAKAKIKAEREKVLKDYIQTTQNEKREPEGLGSKDNPINLKQFKIIASEGYKDFSKFHFQQGIKLGSLELESIDFSYSHMEAADFSNSKLDSCSFNGAELQNACFSNSDMRICLFHNANLRAANFNNSNLNHCRLIQADLRQSSIKNAEITEVEFSNASLIQSNLEGTKLNGANFMGAGMMLSNWQKAELAEGAKVKSSSFREANFSGEDFRTANAELLERSDFTHTNCQHANFEKVQIPISSFFEQPAPHLTSTSGTNLCNANLKDAVFTRTSKDKDKTLVIACSNLSSANLEGADLSEIGHIGSSRFIASNLKNAKTQSKVLLIGCDFRLADLRATTIRDWHFEGCMLFNTKIDNEVANYINGRLDQPEDSGINSIARFDNNLQGLNLEGANLAGAEIKGNLAFTNFRNVNFGSKTLQAALAEHNAQYRYELPRNVDFFTRFISSGGAQDLRFADFRGSNFSNALFSEDPITFTFGILLDPKTSIPSNINESRSSELRTPIQELMHYKDLSNRNLEGMAASNICVVGVDFTNSNLTNSRFNNSFLVKPQMNNSNFKNAQFTESELYNNQLTNSNFEGAEFTKSNLKGAYFDGSNLQNAKFEKNNLSNTSFLGANSLEGADLDYDKVAFAAGGHRNIDDHREKTRRLFIELGCDLTSTTAKGSENDSKANTE